MSHNVIRSDSAVPIRTQLRKILLDEIAEGLFPPESRFPSERGLAQRFSISRPSVRETISELISAGVLFRTVGRGTFVSGPSTSKKSRRVSFLINEDLFQFAQTGYDRILRGVEESCRQNGDMLLFQSVGTDVSAVLSAPPNRPDGFIVVGGVRRPILDALRTAGAPFVLVDLLVNNKQDELETIHIDYSAGTRLAIEHLYGLGHRHIGFIGFAGSAKYEAFWQTLEALGLPYNPRSVEFLQTTDLEPGMLAGFRAAQRIFSRALAPTAILATNDYVALGVMEALTISGLSIPRDVSVIGYDDIAMHSSIPLSTVRVEFERVGALAMGALRERFSSPSAMPAHIEVAVEFVARSSSGRAGANKVG